MDILKLSFLCVIALLPMALLKKYSPEQALLLTLAVLTMVLLRGISLITPLLDALEGLFRRAGIESEYIAILFRTVAASLVTHICADLCRDGGSQTLATLVEISGTVAALLISLPVLQAVTELLLGYFN